MTISIEERDLPVINKVKIFLDARGLTSYRFRKDSGISENTVYSLRDNPLQLPHPSSLSKICNAYKIPPSEILGWVEPSPELEGSVEEVQKYLADILNKPSSEEILITFIKVLAGKSPIEESDTLSVAELVGLPVEEVEALLH